MGKELRPRRVRFTDRYTSPAQASDVRGLGFGGWGLGVGVWGVGFGVGGWSLGVWGLVCGVWGQGSGVTRLDLPEVGHEPGDALS